uniref:Uncharacterized protein n=1 Tax=Amblyomma maculatum TaxID=34609 RepID=G3MRH7_AMBMU
MWLLRKKLYRFVRRIFPSLEYADHETVRRRLSLVYAFTAWQAFVALLVVVYRSKAPSDDRGIDYAAFLASAQKDAKNATILSVSGTSVTRRELSEEDLIGIRQQREEIIEKKSKVQTA